MSPEYRIIIKLNLPKLEEANDLISEITRSSGVIGLHIEELHSGQSEPDAFADLPVIRLSEEEMAAEANKRRATIIKQKRTELGLTQLELASRVGISRGLISMIEKGRTNSSIPTLLAIADELGYSEIDPIRADLCFGGAISPHRLSKDHPIRNRKPRDS